ncbi:hypothetical protein AB0395_09135 [Streptosporangium sp. NPDC051023]|uniref:TRAFAC clade GTPase domain-containing protein n=1 Tax=Streptosporangium sp. NPDC051023 TaxID=3155410 RepID=UPI00344C2D57
MEETERLVSRLVMLAFSTACLVAGSLLFPAVVLLTLIVTTLAAAGYYAYQAGKVLLPSASDGLSVLPPAGGPAKDPAYRHYLLGQVWRDWSALDRATRPVIIGRVRSVQAWIRQRWRDRPAIYFLFTLWLGIEAGVVLAVVALAIVAVLLAVEYALVVSVGLLMWLPCVLVLRGLDLSFALVRRIMQICPHPECYDRLTLPEYACPSCGKRHRRLIPNADGAFRHVCVCGCRLPTTILLGRHRLPAYCPGCDRPLPPRVGVARIEALPFVGGPDAGKTTFMTLVIAALHGTVEVNGGRASFVTRSDEIAFTRHQEEMRLGRVSKTPTPLPTATMLDLSLPAPGGRILYLFDPSGEHYTGATKVEAMSYLAHGEAMVIVIDPFALPLVQDSLTTAERDMLSAAGISFSSEDPADTFQRVRNEFASRPDGGRQKRVAVVVSKADLLEKTTVGRGVNEVPRWLDGMGMGNMVRDLSNRMGEIRYLASGLPPDLPAVARLVEWLVGLVDLPLTASAALPYGRPTTENPRKAWKASARRAGLMPVSYVAARRTVFAASVLLPGATVAVVISVFATR